MPNHSSPALPFKPGEPACTLEGTLDDFSSEELHIHTAHQFLIIRNGVSLLIDKEMKQPLYGTMCAFLPAGLAHRTVVVGGGITYQSIYLKKKRLAEAPRQIVVFPISKLGQALFDRIVKDKEQDFKNGILSEVLSLFLSVSAEDMQKRNLSLSLPQPSSGECCRLIDFIETHFENPISMDQFCSVLPFSTRHISRIFSEEMHVTLFEYLRIYRMIRATVLLHDQDKTILSISMQCGYESLSVFYTDFNRFFSGTPSDFRKLIRQDV